MLLIDSCPAHAAAFKAAVIETSEALPEFECAGTLAAGLQSLADKDVWAIFLNLSLPDSGGIETLDSLRLLIHTTPVVVLGGADDEDVCKTALLHGAQDFLLEGHIDSYSFAGAIRNIEEREVARRELFTEKERAQVTLNSIGDAVLSTDVSGNVTYLNVVAEAMTGWPCKEAVGRALAEVFQLIDGTTHKPAANPSLLAIHENRVVGLAANSILVRRDGHKAAIEDSAAPIHDRDGEVTGAVIVFHDVSMARAMVLEMSHLAQHDVLTDLPNRLLLNDRITQAISLARRNQHQVGVLFVDLDGFKRINDSSGHGVGDKLLQSVAARLASCVRKSDTVSRMGGDEFVILLSEITHGADASISAAKIITELKRVHEIDDLHLFVSASIGISTYPENGENAEMLVKHADTAMYHAKENGRDGYQFFRNEMNVESVERQSLEGQLRYALERDEFVLHYQPKVNLNTGAITSVEALVRWQHPSRGLLLPGEFLGIAEVNGLIVGIGQWVLREACRQTRAWLDAGLPAVPVAVNISSVEFRNEHFFEGVRVALKKNHLDPKFLELELTETVLMRHAESTASALDQLKGIGVRLAVDDFGTGHSSLSYLTRFPIDTLKLDQSFVRDVFACGGDAIVVCAVIGMGNSLKHRVVAEGVETFAQMEFLQTHGCEEGQGYYFSRPVPASEFAELLETGLVPAVHSQQRLNLNPCVRSFVAPAV
jgi:diguanylate cyclase (GGDEF)-like protein/PAS domain S-box-containing protein